MFRLFDKTQYIHIVYHSLLASLTESSHAFYYCKGRQQFTTAQLHHHQQQQQHHQQQQHQGNNDFFNFGGFNFSDEFNAALDHQLNLNASVLNTPVTSNSSSNNNSLGHHVPSAQQIVNSIAGLPSPPTSSPAQLSLPSPHSCTNGSGGSPPGTPLTPLTDYGTPGPSPSMDHSPSTSHQSRPRRHSSGSSVNDITSIPSLQVRLPVVQQRVSI